ncbi:MAG: ADP-glyceromanno-heptose 6-epimerase [Vicinamibacterales bacterium]
MIAVTGAAGFIGSAVVWALNQRGERAILCVDTDLSAHRYKNLKPLRYGSYLCHDEFLAAMARGAYKGRLAAVIHLGACSSTTETNWDYLRANNLEYSQTLCKASVDAGARFLQASSAATYGDGEQGYNDDHAGLDALKPLNLYARSKHEFDLWARDEGHLDHIAALKYFNVYGPNEWHKEDMRSMVCKGFEQIRDTGKVRLFKSERPEFADGGQRRDFLYVKDAVAMTLWLFDHPEHNGIFNIGTGVSTDWNRLMSAIFAAMDRSPAIDYIDMPAHIAKAYQYDTCADMTKLHTAGYDAPMTAVEDAVREYVVNHLMTAVHLTPA